MTGEQVFLGVLRFTLVSGNLPNLHSFLTTALAQEHPQTQPWKSPSNGVYGVLKQWTNVLHIFISWLDIPWWAGRPSSFFRLQCHTQTHHTRYDSSGGVISPSQRTLPDNTQHLQETDIPSTGGIRTRNPSKRKVADPRLKPRGRRDRLLRTYRPVFM